jgi:fatty acid desaturase
MSSSTLTTSRGSEYAELSRLVQDARLLDRRPVNYLLRGSLTLLALALTWAAFVVIGPSWFQLIVAAVLGILFTQVAFLGHDSGHRQVCRTRRANDVLGLIVGDLLIGLSFGWWLDKHNRHHAHPNQEGADPDIASGVLAFSEEQVAARTSPLARAVARSQAWLFFPMLTLEGINLHVASVLSLVTGKGRRYRLTETVLLAVHLIGYATALIWVLGPVKALAFAAVHQAVFGFYMGCSFAPNHKGMPLFERDQTVDFLRRQVLTSRNVRGGWFTDLLLGGLNYQVEHHLFPSMPRANLPAAQPIVRAFCAARGILYTETSLVGSYAAALRHLHQVGRPAAVSQ